MTQTHFPSRLLSDSFRLPIQQVVSKFIGMPWHYQTIRDLQDYASHPTAILSDEHSSVFVKLSEAANGQEQFELELAGLKYLAAHAGTRIPKPIAILPIAEGTLMIMAAEQSVERGAEQWREIGRTLARIHLVKGTSYGFGTSNYFGPLVQDNKQESNWATFYALHRLLPRLQETIRARQLSVEQVTQIEKLIGRLPSLCGPDIAPTLLHGDGQQNNFISTAQGAVVIDPAVYYGIPEIDLAYLDCFQDVPDDVFAGYRELLPIESDFAERRDLWRVYLWLSAVVSGAPYVEKLMDCVCKYL